MLAAAVFAWKVQAAACCAQLTIAEPGYVYVSAENVSVVDGKVQYLTAGSLAKLFISSVKQGRNEISLVFLSFTASVSRIAQEITDEFA